MTLEVLDPGLLLTVQDLGRPGYEHLGVPRAGAVDARSIVAANRLVGNEPDAAALEATLLGPRLRAIHDIRIAIAGANLEPVVQPGGRPIDVARPIRLAAGDQLGFLEAGGPERGCRAYVAVAGGIDVPVILGSRSTSLVGAFGGLEGRPLRAGDVLTALDSARDGTIDESEDDDVTTTLPSPDRPIRLLAGPAAAEPGGEQRLLALLDTRWTVGLDSDRRGLRLESAGDAGSQLAASGDRPSQGLVVGAIQLTPSGQPLVLMPDAGTTGGYPVIAVVASADLPRLGQLAPGTEIRFARARVRFSE
jgi:antagonist of KipI